MGDNFPKTTLYNNNLTKGSPRTCISPNKVHVKIINYKDHILERK